MSRASYTTEVFGHPDYAAGSLRSARTIVPLVVRLTSPASVMDVGCGTGIWLSVFQECGIEDICGMDGGWVPPESLRIPRDRFVPADLAAPIRLDRRFDLVVSVEVAEHLPPASARSFVDSLVGLGPAVLFSAAIPHQGGFQHVNEQWPDYWIEQFERCGYVAVDCVRPVLWHEPQIEWWYLQTMFLFATPEYIAQRPALARDPASRPSLASVVHPRYYLDLVEHQRHEAARLADVSQHPARHLVRALAKKVTSRFLRKT